MAACPQRSAPKPQHTPHFRPQAGDAAWTNWLRARAAAGASWDELQASLKERYDATKGTTKQSYDDWARSARATFDEGARAGGGWWDTFADRVACTWDAARCRVQETLGMGAAVSCPARCNYVVQRCCRCWSRVSLAGGASSRRSLHRRRAAAADARQARARHAPFTFHTWIAVVS
jgi:hypothetical protein